MRITEINRLRGARQGFFGGCRKAENIRRGWFRRGPQPLKRSAQRSFSAPRGNRATSLSAALESKRRAARILRLTQGAGPWPAARRAGVLFSAFVLAACAPTIHLDAPAMPAMDPQRGTYCTFTEKAPLDPAPQLPDVGELSPCPAGSGFVTCFTLDQDRVRQKRFKILHDDRDYCRDAYDRGLTRSDGGAATRGDGDAVKGR